MLAFDGLAMLAGTYLPVQGAKPQIARVLNSGSCCLG
jgi:hypothetical protein